MGRNHQYVRSLWVGLCCVACGRTELSAWTLGGEAESAGGASGVNTTGVLTGTGGGSAGGSAGSGASADSVGGSSTAGGGGEQAVEVRLTATTDRSEAVVLNWSVAGLSPARFVLEKDGLELLEVGADIRAYADGDALEGTWSAPENLVASRGTRAVTVDLAWQSTNAIYYAHRYRLFAVASDGAQYASNTAEGWRSAPELVEYEISRDDGQSWVGVGLTTTLDDAYAPLGLLTAPTEALPRVERDYVRLSVTAEPTFVPTEVTYRVRARSERGPGPPSNAARGYRARGDLTSYQWQWQRSSADSDADYADLGGVTGAIWFSPAPVGAGHFYRAALSAEGAAGFSEPARAELVPFTSLSAGAFQTCGLTPTHLGRCWGDGDEGPSPEMPLQNLSAGPGGGCGIREDGKRVCWGNSSWSSQVFPHEPSAETFTAVSSGLRVSCGILEGGELVCWGDAGMATPLTGSFKSVSVGAYHACAIDDDDRVQCWGENYLGQAPPGPSSDQFKQVAASWGDHTCGVRLDGKVVCWGRNDRGQAPPEASTESFVSVAAGVWNSCGLSSDRKLSCWGDETLGQAPVGVSSEEYDAVTMGYYHTCALRVDGGVRCWGFSEHGQQPYAPRSETFESVSVGNYSYLDDEPHACGITTEGKLVCWGNNDQGQAPRGPSQETYKQVAAGWWHTCALGSDGKLLCWGYDPDGRAPAGPSGETYSDLSVDSQSTCALGTDSSIRCFGAAAGAAIWGTMPTAAKAVSVDDHVCALDLEGQLACWGWREDPWGLTPVSSPGPFQSVSASYYHTCALGTDQALSCWGDLDPFDDIEPSWTNERLSSIDTGSDTLCGIRPVDGRLICSTPDGGWFDTPSLDSFFSVSVGNHHFCAVRSDRKVLCLGERSGM